MADESLGGAQGRAGPKKRTGVWFLLVALLFLCLFALYRSPLLRLSGVEVTGLNRLTRERVMEAAGLELGVPRLERSSSAIVSRLSQEPWVKSAEAAWAGNKVTINLTERVPVGLVRYYDLYYLALDETGVVLQATTLEAEKGMPVISGVQVTKGLRGQQLQHQGLLDALTVLSRMGPSMLGQVSEVHVDTDRSLTLYMTGGATVLWGNVPDGKDRYTATEQKWAYFGGVWKDLQRRKSSSCHIDLRVEGSAISAGCS